MSVPDGAEAMTLRDAKRWYAERLAATSFSQYLKDVHDEVKNAK